MFFVKVFIIKTTIYNTPCFWYNIFATHILKKEGERMKRKLTVFCFILLVCVLFSSCANTKYNGEREDLYTVAVNNIFGIFGYASNGEVTYSPDITVIETDDYGRTLFFYDEYYDDSINPELDYGMAFVIMQKSQDGYVYYYEDVCYLPIFSSGDDPFDFENGAVLEDDSFLTELKERNDWNEAVDIYKCKKAKVIDEKSDGKLRVSETELDELIFECAKENGYTGTDDNSFRFSNYCNSDIYGRELYYIYCFGGDDVSEDETEYFSHEFALIVEPDGSISKDGIVQINNMEDSYEAVAELKESYGWDSEYNGEYMNSVHPLVIVGWVFAVIAVVFLIAAVVFFARFSRERIQFEPTKAKKRAYLITAIVSGIFTACFGSVSAALFFLYGFIAFFNDNLLY